MAARKERWRSASEDERPGRKMKARERSISVRERKKAAGKPENGSSKQNGRREAKKTAGEAISPSGWRKRRPGREKRRWGALEMDPGALTRGSLTSEVRQGKRCGGRSPW